MTWTPPSPADVFMPFQDGDALGPVGPFNWGYGAMNWHTPAYNVPVDASVFGFLPSGDAWASTSGHTGLESISNILRRDSPLAFCIGVATTDSYSMTAGPAGWSSAWPFRCITPQTSYIQDGPAIHYDSGGNGFWAVSSDFSVPAQITLRSFPNCHGAPGTAACPQQAAVAVDTYFERHATVTVNPCTHHAVVAYRHDPAALGQIFLKFYRNDGTPVGNPFAVDGAAPFQQTQLCTAYAQPKGMVPRCGDMDNYTDCSTDGAGCANLTSKVHVTTKASWTDGQCYAYVAYDSNFNNVFTGVRHMRANLAVVNITSETAPFLAASTLRYPSNLDVFDAFGSTSSANEFTDGVGWFFYSQSNAEGYSDPCQTSYIAFTHPDRGLGPSWTWSSNVLDDGFPTLRTYGADYVGIVKRGFPGGILLPTWHRPVVSTGTNYGCVMCGGTKYSRGIFAEQVTP
jgi:hypothetical protein